jgi:Zinc knuckle
MTSIPMAQTQVVADKAKEYRMNKPMPFTGDRTKIRWFLQDCLGYPDMNQGIYNTDRRFILSYMIDGEAANWKEYYLDTLEDPNTGMPNFPTLVTFLADVQKAFRATDWVQDGVNRLETLKQSKKTAEELNTEFLQIVGQMGMDRKTPSENPSKQKGDTNKSNGNACWWRTSDRKDPNVMDVNALTIEERGMLLRQEKCFRCRKTGHMAKDCPPEQGESSKQKKVDPARFAYTMIKALTKKQRESFTKMVMEDKDGEDF